MKSFVVALPLVPHLRVGYAAAQLDEVNVMGLIGSQVIRGQGAALNYQRQGDCSFHNNQHRQNNVSHWPTQKTDGSWRLTVDY